MERSTKVLIALGLLVAAGLTTAAVVEASAPAPAPAPPAPPGPVVQTLIPGHRYSAVYSCPSPIAQPIYDSSSTNVVTAAYNLGAWTIVFDFVAAAPAPLSAAAPGCTVVVADMGLSPPVVVLSPGPLPSVSVKAGVANGGLQLQAHAYGGKTGVINSVLSSSPLVVAPFVGWGQPIAVLLVLMPGVTGLTVYWNDANGNSQTSQLIITAS